MAAIVSGREGEHVDESHWSDLAKGLAYSKSKTMAERAMWDFKKKMESEGAYCPEFVALNPSVVLGELIKP